MNDRPEAEAMQLPQGDQPSRSRRSLRYLLYSYGSSIVAGVICGVLLGNSWSNQPVRLSDQATLPPASTTIALRPSQAPDLEPNSAAKAAESHASDVSQPPPAPAPSQPLPAPVPESHPSLSTSDTSGPHKTSSPTSTTPESIAPSPPSPDSKSRVAPEATYIVQVGAFSEASNAATVVSQLKKDGYEADMLKTNDHAGRALYRVYIGRFSDATRAKAAAEAFRGNQKRDAYAVRY